MRTLILNSSNISSTSGNNVLTYTFPQGSVTFKSNKVGLQAVSLYYSWQNVSASISWSYKWVDGVTYPMTLPAGFYAVSDFNSFIQATMYANGHYLVNSSGSNVYYLELQTNSVYYSVQLNSYAVPTALPSGWSKPSSATWSFPASATTPQLIIPSGLSSLLGITTGTYPSVSQTTNYSHLSDTTPQITPVQSVVMTCSLINSRYSNPATLLTCFSPNVTYGSLISVTAHQPVMNEIQDGSYTSFMLQFFDQSLNSLAIKDSNLVVLLVIE